MSDIKKTVILPQFRITEEMYTALLEIAEDDPMSNKIPDHLRAAINLYIRARRQQKTKETGRVYA